MAVVLGAAGVLVAWVPVWTFAVVLLGPAALACGLVGVGRPGPTPRRCIVGAALGGLALLMMTTWPLLFLLPGSR